jgi:hypothetical protein
LQVAKQNVTRVGDARVDDASVLSHDVLELCVEIEHRVLICSDTEVNVVALWYDYNNAAILSGQ